MTKKTLDVLETITAKILAYQPADKAKWAKSAKARKSKEKQDDSHSSI